MVSGSTEEKPVNRKLKAKIVEVFGSQANFAEIVRTHESVVSRVVRGRQKLGEETERLWARVLGKKREEIFREN